MVHYYGKKLSGTINGKFRKWKRYYKISNDAARKAFDIIGNEEAGWFGFQPLLQRLLKST